MPQVRQDLRVLLQLSNDIEVVGEAGDGQDAIKQAELLHPDVVIMDLEMPILDGIQATYLIKHHKLAKRVVILSVHSELEDINRAKQAGADTFIQKGSPYSALIESIHPNKP
jgi:DNA-binding NarL/FixJ family response regulator